MDPEAFRRFGHEVIDWITDYLQHAERYPVLPRVTLGEIRETLAKPTPPAPDPYCEYCAFAAKATSA